MNGVTINIRFDKRPFYGYLFFTTLAALGPLKGPSLFHICLPLQFAKLTLLKMFSKWIYFIAVSDSHCRFIADSSTFHHCFLLLFCFFFCCFFFSFSFLLNLFYLLFSFLFLIPFVLIIKVLHLLSRMSSWLNVRF